MKLYLTPIALTISIGFAQSQAIQSSSFSPEISKIIERKYSKVGEFNQFGLAAVSKTMVNGTLKWGFINKDGKELIPISYDKISDFDKNGLVVVTEKLKICFDEKSDKCQADVIYDYKGNMVFGKPNQMVKLKIADTTLSQSLILVKTTTSFESKESENGYSFIKKESLKAITNDFITSFQVVGKNEILVKSPNRAWTIDFNGKEVFGLKYKDIVSATDGVYGVRYDNDKYGFVDKKGKIMASFNYETISPFNNGLSIVSLGNNKVGIISKLNAQIAPCTFKNIRLEEKTYILEEETGSKFILNEIGDCIVNCEKFYKIVKSENTKK